MSLTKAPTWLITISYPRKLDGWDTTLRVGRIPVAGDLLRVKTGHHSDAGRMMVRVTSVLLFQCSYPDRDAAADVKVYVGRQAVPR